MYIGTTVEDAGKVLFEDQISFPIITFFISYIYADHYTEYWIFLSNLELSTIAIVYTNLIKVSILWIYKWLVILILYWCILLILDSYSLILYKVRRFKRYLF